MARPKRDVEAALLAKGFQARSGDHTYLIYITNDGKKSMAKTKTSHGSSGRDIDDSLLAMMARQCALTKKQFLELLDCPMSREEYEGTLRQNGKA